MGVLYKLLAEWTGEYSLMFLVEVATQSSKSWDPVSNQTCPFSHALPDLSSKILTRLQPWLLKVTLGLRTRYLVLLINNDNDFEVAHPQSVSSYLFQNPSLPPNRRFNHASLSDITMLSTSVIFSPPLSYSLITETRVTLSGPLHEKWNSIWFN